MNPNARSERAQDIIQKLEQVATGADIWHTEGPGMGKHLAAQAAAQGYEIVVAVGGDGTVKEVVNGLRGTTATLGVIPAGTMNIFAKEHQIPEDLEAAWAVIVGGCTREFDLCDANGVGFVQMAGVGFDAQVVKATTLESKKRFGPLSYVLSAAQVAWHAPPRLQVEMDGTVNEGACVLVGNGRYYGAKLSVFPNARPDDGLLDVLILKNLSYIDMARYLGSVLVGGHTALPDVRYVQTRELTVRSSEPVPFEVDGELAGEAPVTLRVAGKLRVCTQPYQSARA